MGVLTTGNTYSTADQVTASNLNSSVNDATFQSAAVDNTSTQLSGGAIIVKDEGITQDKIAPDAVGTDELANDVVINTSGSITSSSVSVADGSESVPSITNTGDTNTGIYFPAENSIALTAGAGATLTSTNTAITIDVPTSIVSAAQSDLTLQGGDANSKNLIFKKASAQQGKISAVGDELKCYAGTSTTESLRLTTTGAFIPGNLFVGTDDTDPHGLIQVYGGGTGQAEGGEIQLRTAADYDSTYNHYFIDAYQDDLRIGREGAADITLNSAGNVGIGTTAPSEELHISASVPKIQIQDSDGTNQYGQLYHSAGTTVIQARNNVTDGTIVFQKYDGTTTDETMRIDSSGNVGIGTASPAAPLDVVGAIRGGSLAIGTDDTTAGTISAYGDGTGSSEGGQLNLYIAADHDSTYNRWQIDAYEDDLRIFTDVGEVIRVTPTGNVGIGTSTPTAPLEVASTTGGVIMPRMTTTQKNAISSPTNGEMVYDTTNNKFYGYAGGSWVAFH